MIVIIINNDTNNDYTEGAARCDMMEVQKDQPSLLTGEDKTCTDPDPGTPPPHGPVPKNPLRFY